MLWLHRQNFEVLRLPGLAQTCPTLVVTGTDWRGMPAQLDVTNHLCQGGLQHVSDSFTRPALGSLSGGWSYVSSGGSLLIPAAVHRLPLSSTFPRGSGPAEVTCGGTSETPARRLWSPDCQVRSGSSYPLWHRAARLPWGPVLRKTGSEIDRTHSEPRKGLSVGPNPWSPQSAGEARG